MADDRRDAQREPNGDAAGRDAMPGSVGAEDMGPETPAPVEPPPASLRQVLGALIFAAGRPLDLDDLRGCLRSVAAAKPDRVSALYAGSTPADIRAAVADLQHNLNRLEMGFEIVEVAGGYRLQSRPSCGPWVRALLQKPPKTLLTQPALETLAIIAYRQPLPRAEIESIRGVSVAHVLKALMTVRLVRVAGRSDLPGRPYLYGTTTAFLEHFGLRSLSDLEQVDPTLKRAFAAAARPVPRPDPGVPDDA